jgi:outer membrane receptor protein involved in Fe transport
VGVFPTTPAFFADSTTQRLDYREVAVGFNVNHLIGDEFAVGAGYRVTRSELLTEFPELIGSGSPIASLKNEATLHEVLLNANWNSASGLFATAEANWYMQDLKDDPLAGLTRSGDEFWQLNAFLGYRFNRNLCEVSAGVLNITDNDYQLSPLSPYGTIARDRTAVLRCRFSF